MPWQGYVAGQSSLTEMESDLCAVDGLKSSVLVKLQELSIGGEKKAPVRKVRVSSSSIVPFRRKRNSTKPSNSYGIHFRSSSMKAQSSFWSEACSALDKSSKTTSGLRICC